MFSASDVQFAIRETVESRAEALLILADVPLGPKKLVRYCYQRHGPPTLIGQNARRPPSRLRAGSSSSKSFFAIRRQATRWRSTRLDRPRPTGLDRTGGRSSGAAHGGNLGNQRDVPARDTDPSTRHRSASLVRAFPCLAFFARTTQPRRKPLSAADGIDGPKVCN